MNTTLHDTQVNYTIAKALYTEAIGKLAEYMAPYTHLLDEDGTDFGEYTDIEMAAEARLGLNDLRSNLHAAEEALIAWSFERARQAETYTCLHEATLRDVYNKRHMPRIRTKMIDLAMRLAA